MSLIGNDFVPAQYPYAVRCSECGKKMLAGETVLVSLKDGKVKKRICSEECRLTFDDKFWRAAAIRNAHRREHMK